MKTVCQTELYAQPIEKVFDCLDSLGITGAHMTQSSAMMMGSKLKLAFLTENHTGLGCIYRWSGKMMGLKMDFVVEVTKWVQNKEKTWETIGEPKLIIYAGYRMNLLVMQVKNGTQADLSISYESPKRFFNKILCFLFADSYCRWCLNKMLGDAGKALVVLETG